MNTDTTSDTAADTDTEDTAPTFAHSATYSPEDNKLRIYPAHRLSAEEYARVKEAGFAWAPKQEIFVAPMWTPGREDLARELCGDIGDDDTSLTERAEDRADRFDGYKERRADEAAAARDQVQQIAGRFEFGQPILVGHHSERKARKDAERMQAGMRRAVAAWETSEYWERRAAGAIRHARYKELPAVRHRRIKGIESDQRKAQRNHDEAAGFLKAWRGLLELGGLALKSGGVSSLMDGAQYLAGRDHISRRFTLADFPRQPPASQYEGSMSLYSALTDGVCTPEQAAAIAIRTHERQLPHLQRWLAHYANRLAYERAMLDESGGLEADRWDITPGGQVLGRHGWAVVVRVNKVDGRVNSLTITGQSWVLSIEDVRDYRPATDEAAAAVARATKLPPLVNYDGGAGFARMTEAQYKALYEGARSIRPIKATETHGVHRVRHVNGYKSREFGGPAAQSWDIVPVFLTDAKVKPAPLLNEPAKPARKSLARQIAEAEGVDTAGQPDPEPAPAPAPVPSLRDVIAEATAPRLADVLEQTARMEERQTEREQQKTEAAPFEAMRQALRNGTAVQVVSAPQLFPTPDHVAERMVSLAGADRGARVLEPSAGTGQLLMAWGRTHGWDSGHVGRVQAIEINHALAVALRARFDCAAVQCADFLSMDPAQMGAFDVALMNPPFENGADIKHVQHARRFLAPGGRLVGICAAGPRQHAALQPLCESWEYLEPGTFEGTNVRAVLFTMGG